MEQNSLLHALNWRYATNQFDPNEVIEESVLMDILEAGNLTATSFGIQPYKLILLEGKTWSPKLKEATFAQSNIQTCSHILVLARRTDIDANYIDDYSTYMEEVRGLESGSLVGFADSCKKFVARMDNHQKEHWTARQVYIVLGNLLSACALAKVDACPMEGFIASEVDKILDLNKQNLKTVLMLPMGYRSKDDIYANVKKVRKPLRDMLIRM